MKIVKYIIGLSLILISCNSNENLKEIYNRKGDLEKSYQIDENGKLHGEMITYYSDQKIREKMNYNHGVLHGRYFNYKLNGELQKKGIYNKGKLIGDLEFYEQGKRCSVISYDSNGVKCSTIDYYVDGRVKQQICFFAGTRYVSARKVYKENGKVDNYKSNFLTIDKKSKEKYKVTFYSPFEGVIDSVNIISVDKFSRNLGGNFNSKDVLEITKIICGNQKEYLSIDLDKMIPNKNGVINIVFEVYQKSSEFGVLKSSYFLQFKSKRNIPKSNLVPIYFNR